MRSTSVTLKRPTKWPLFWNGGKTKSFTYSSLHLCTSTQIPNVVWCLGVIVRQKVRHTQTKWRTLKTKIRPRSYVVSFWKLSSHLGKVFVLTNRKHLLKVYNIACKVQSQGHIKSISADGHHQNNVYRRFKRYTNGFSGQAAPSNCFNKKETFCCQNKQVEHISENSTLLPQALREESRIQIYM